MEGPNYSVLSLASGRYFIIRNNTFSADASPNFDCPSLIENNVNQTGTATLTRPGCTFVNNVGFLGY